MPERNSENDMLLLKAEEWTPPKTGRTKLEGARDAIFHLRRNKGLSYTAIKRFLSEAGMATSTAALSQFFRSRFPEAAAAATATAVMSRLAKLQEEKAGSQNSQTT